MPRAKSKNRNELVNRALHTFWEGGYKATSMGDLVRETGVSRSGIYADFGGKDELFRACLEQYRDEVVSASFGVVEEAGAGFEDMQTYFERIIDISRSGDNAGVGCLVANSVGQVDADDTQTQALLEAHGNRLVAGFKAVLTQENKAKQNLSKGEIEALAEFAMISVQGLWSFMRNKTDPDIIRQHSETLLSILRARVG